MYFLVYFISDQELQLRIGKAEFDVLQHDIANKKGFTLLDDKIVNHADISRVYEEVEDDDDDFITKYYQGVGLR